MDRKTIRHQIEAIQQSAYRNAGITAPLTPQFPYSRMLLRNVFDLLLFERGLERKLKGMVLALRAAGTYQARPPISAHEIPTHYAYLMASIESVHKSVIENFTSIQRFYQALGIHVAHIDADAIVLATVPAAEPTVYVKNLSASKHILILFNISIVPVICGISRLVAASVDLQKTQTSIATQYNIPNAVHNITEFTDAFKPLLRALQGLIYGDVAPLWGVASAPRGPERQIYFRLRSAMTTYVVAHELGHVMLAHPADDNSDEFSAEQELDADVFAFLLNVFVQQQDALDWGFAESQELFEASAVSAFMAQDMLLRAYWMVEGICFNLCGETTSKSRITHHPPYGERLRVLKECAGKVIPQEREILEHASAMHRELFQNVGNMFVAHAQVMDSGRQVSPFLRKALGI